MSLLKNPTEITSTDAWAGMIYGEPGTGKSTLALSSPEPVSIDADRGMKRVQKRYQKISLQPNGYQDFLDLLETHELDPFETIVIDTAGKLVDMIGDWLCKQDPKNRKKSGGLSIAGYGSLKTEFARLVRDVKSRGKYLLFIAHGREEKDGDTTKVRPDIAGSSGKDLVKELDFMGYVEMNGKTRTISFAPTEKFYAKNSLGLPEVIEIPDPDKVGNDFIKKYIVERTRQRAVEEAAENKKYDDLIDNLKTVVSGVKDAKTAYEALATINMAPVIWDSARVAKNALIEKIKVSGLVYNKDKKAFEPVPAPPVAEVKQPEQAAA